MALSWWEKGLLQIEMHHWTVHAKVDFLKFPPDVRSWGGGSIPQLLILNWEMNIKAISTRCQILGWGVYSTTFDPELRNETFTLISFMGFPAILSTLQPFEICIFNRENSKLTFSNGPQLMGKRFIADLHASLDSTGKSRISKIFHQMSDPGVGGPFHNFWSWTEKWI